MKQLRIFYTPSAEIIKLYGLEGSDDFPLTLESQLEELPSGTRCITLADSDQINTFFSSNNNTIIDDKVVIGDPILPPIIPKPRDLAKEIDKLKARVDLLAPIA